MTIRPMDAADIPAVQAVERDAGELFRSFPEPRIAACADHGPMPEHELSELVVAQRAWVACVDGDVVGFLVVRVFDGCGHVEEVAVRRRDARRGHATALLEQAATWTRKVGLSAVTLTTFRDVPWNRPFYERRGFRVVEEAELSSALVELLVEEDQHYGLARDLRVVMRRDLPPREVRPPLRS